MNENVESGAVSEESEVQVEQEKISSDGRDERSSQAELDERITEHIQQEVERRFQSAKDRRWAQLERQFGSLHELSERAGTQPPEIREIGGENLEGQVMAWAARLLEKVGLGNDPEAVAILQGSSQHEDAEEYLNLLEDLTSLVLRRVGREEIPAALVVQPSGGIAPAQDLRQVYDQRKEQLRPGDVNALMALKREFREKGLDIF